MEILEATKELIDKFEMSEADFKEQVASGNQYVFERPQDYIVIVDNDNVLGLGGLTDTGTIWLLTSHLVEKLSIKDKQKFVKLVRKQVENYKKHNKDRMYFVNSVWEHNTSHIKFVESCGGVFLYEKAYKTIIGETFIPFIIPNDYHEGGY